jgi:hypothetical protein
VAQEMGQWLTLLNMAINLKVSKRQEISSLAELLSVSEEAFCSI